MLVAIPNGDIFLTRVANPNEAPAPTLAQSRPDQVMRLASIS